MHTEFWLENVRGRDQVEDLGVDGNIILKCIFNEIGLEDTKCNKIIYSGDGLYDHCDEPSGFITSRNFLSIVEIDSTGDEGMVDTRICCLLIYLTTLFNC